MMDILREIWMAMKRNKLRTALTGFAVAWGIFMLIVLLGAGNGLINAQMSQMDRFLANSIMVGSGYTSTPYQGLREGRQITLNDADIALTETGFRDHVSEVGATLQRQQLTISYEGEYINSNVTGVYPNEMKINKLEILFGRFINSLDMRDKRKVVVLSEDDAKVLMKGSQEHLVGKFVKIGTSAFRVIGVSKADQTSINTSAYVPFTTMRSMYNEGNRTGNIQFAISGLETLEENEDFEQQYRARVNANHQAAPDDEGALWIWNRYTQNMQMSTGVGIIRTALWIIGLFTLLSGVVGVSNIMLITVKERTREFGIRKAIGATPMSILRLIIAESIIITAFFGYIGMVLGVAANEYMNLTLGGKSIDSGLFEMTIFSNPTVGIDVCLQATLVMVVAGTIAGLIPARKAARIRPIEALRAE
ncbi:MAG: ABC transporter permease [Prevotella sp.]|nr:ABC transporter permease [Prevotella sp.]